MDATKSRHQFGTGLYGPSKARTFALSDHPLFGVLSMGSPDRSKSTAEARGTARLWVADVHAYRKGNHDDDLPFAESGAIDDFVR